MKNLIFRKFAKDTLVFFILMCFIVGLIVWTLQAVNYFDFVVQDGHGLGTYFGYIASNFPKIIHRIIPFIFFISLFFLFYPVYRSSFFFILFYPFCHHLFASQKGVSHSRAAAIARTPSPRPRRWPSSSRSSRQPTPRG